MCWYENLSSFPSLVLVSKLPKISGVPCNYFENFSTLMGYFSHFRFALKLYHDAKKKAKANIVGGTWLVQCHFF